MSSNGDQQNTGGSNGNKCPMMRDHRHHPAMIRETITPSSTTSTTEQPLSSSSSSNQQPKSRSCPITINGPEFRAALKSKLDAAGISLCPVMGRGRQQLSTDQFNSATTAISSNTPTDSLRPDTPDEEKLDLKHLSVALMKLLYPKVSE